MDQNQEGNASTPQLAPRQQRILHAIVVEYVLSAEPIGSEAIAGKYELGVKSATVRNEMSDMADRGYLSQPHTSAGRVPSDLGYRFYVDRLIVEREVTESSQSALRSATDSGDALQEVLRDTLRTLSRITHQLTVAATTRDSGLLVRNAVLSALGPSQFLLVLILNNGRIENRMIEGPPGATLEDIGLANKELSVSVAGKTVRGLSRSKAPTSGVPSVDRLLLSAWTSLRAMTRELTKGVLLTEGEEFIVAQPEFQRDIGFMTDLLSEITSSDLLQDALIAPDQTQVVTIGRENRDERLQTFSIVRRAFFVGPNEAGVLALVGPTRMSYEQGIPLVNFTAGALSQSLTKYLG
jgi:heat-inducible transcriptional repressor